MVETVNYLLGRLNTEYEFLMNNKGLNPPKFLKYINGDLNVRCTTMVGELSTGFAGSYVVFVNDYTKEVDLRVSTGALGRLNSYGGRSLVALKMALNVAYVLQKTNRLHCRIGLIGGGKNNLMTALILKQLGVNRITLYGGRFEYSKNHDVFRGLTGIEIGSIEEFYESEVLVSCISGNDVKVPFYNVKDFPLAIFSVTQDTGFCLDESFRAFGQRFSDYPEQVYAHRSEEYPFDKTQYLYNDLYLLKDVNSRVSVSLFGAFTGTLVLYECLMAGDYYGKFFSEIERIYSESLKQLYGEK